MSMLADIDGTPRSTSAAAGRADRSLFESVPAVMIIGLCIGLAMSWQKLLAVWQTGLFFDTDDAMHLVQVRDWLAGQGWFDLTAYRLDPPQGVVMHWTRLIDLPLAFLIKAFAPFAGQEAAERLTRIVYPVLLLAGFYAAVIWVARKLVGVGGIGVAVVLAAFSMAAVVQFPAGRINHHNVQIVLLMLMIGTTLDSFDPRLARRGALAGVLAAASLAISIEDLPFIAAMIAIFGIAWVVRGAPMARALAWFGSGFAAAAILGFVATVPPRFYAEGACDAFSAAHLLAACLCGTGFVILAAATPRLTHRGWRLAACALAGAAAVAGVALSFPACLGDPFAAVDSLVREVWLANVTQTQPLARLLRLHLLSTLPTAMPIFLGFAFICLAAWRETGERRARWLAVAGFAGIGLLGSFWEVRVATYAAAITGLGGAWLFVRLLRWSAPRARVLAAVPALLTIPLVPAAWALALPDGHAGAAAPYGSPEACFATAAFTALEALPPSLVLAPIDAGPYILALTHHSVVAGPYHRDNHGNRLAIETFIGDEATAHARAKASGAAYLVICPAADELSVYAGKAPDGFAVRLRDGAAPAWLEPVAVPGTPYKVYRLR